MNLTDTIITEMNKLFEWIKNVISLFVLLITFPFMLLHKLFISKSVKNNKRIKQELEDFYK